MRGHILDLKNAVNMSHFIMRHASGRINTAIDATCGNGKDTVLLADLVGAGGRVYAFDIQARALENTRQALAARELLDRVQLISSSHEVLTRYVSGPVQAVMFNLGYLPGGDHCLVTGSASTIRAVESALQILDRDGLMTIVVYTGHEGGEEEYEALSHYLNLIPQSCADVLETSYINQANQPASLFVVIKKSLYR